MNKLFFTMSGGPFRLLLPMLILWLAFVPRADASIAYGSINNFDTVNDTGHECHGFEIEIEDCHSTDITYTYNYNHYGVPKITQDDSVAGHPKCVIRWESKKNADGSWAAYTAIPSGPIAPTNGHMFTNPGVNFGGEHFGVGYSRAVGIIRYQWLIDNGSGTLVHGGAVQVSTPTFNYFPPVVGNPAPAQVQAVIAPPPPPAPEPMEFGKAVWVKEIRTTTHNNNEVKLRDLVSDDPDDDHDKNWKNGEPDEVEVEWQILQKDYNKADGGANNQVPAAAEALPDGDEVVTRRYEFYKYVGPIDDETGEAKCQKVGPDDIHGSGVKTINGVSVDLSTVVVVGDYTGAQMAAVDVDAGVGLIDHVGEAEVGVEFAARTVVIQGVNPFTATREGALPTGMVFDEVSGVLSGTPEESGEFVFQITATDGVNPEVTKKYTLVVAAANAELPPLAVVDTTGAPADAGTTTGDGAYDVGGEATVTAQPLAGFAFLNWTDNGTVVSTQSTYRLTMDVNHSLVAHFVPAATCTISTSSSPVAGGTISGGGVCTVGSNVTLTATPSAGYAFDNWSENGGSVSTSATLQFTAAGDRTLIANFVRVYTLSITANGGAVSRSPDLDVYPAGATVTLTATADAGRVFTGWTGDANGTENPLTVTINADATIGAVFDLVTFTVSSAAGPGGSISPTGQQTVSQGGSVAFLATPAADGYGVDQWWVNNVAVRQGGNAFTLANVTADTAVQVTFKKAVPVLHPFAPGSWTITDNVDEVITADNNPTRFSVSGLPAGVVLAPATGRLSGRPHVPVCVSRTYHLVITATNSTGTSAPLRVDVSVEPVARMLVGTFQALVERSDLLGDGFGGSLRVATTSTGACSGRLRLGTSSYPFVQQRLQATVGGNGEVSVLIRRKPPLSDLTISFTIQKDDGDIDGTLTDGVVAVPLVVHGVRQSAPPSALTGRYTAALEIDPDLSGTDVEPGNGVYPQGCGYGTLVVRANGEANWTGRMADGTGVSHTTLVGPEGELPVHLMLYDGAGSVHGWMNLSSPGSPVLDGTLDWSKLPQDGALVRNYRAGFPVHDLTVIGGRYSTPVAPALVLGLADGGVGSTNARLTFAEGGLLGPPPIVPAVMAPSLLTDLRIKSGGSVVMPDRSSNPAGVFLSLNPVTGSISGGFVLKDSDPTDHAAPIGTVTRQVSFHGLLVTRAGFNKGAGFFLLPKLPSDGPPKTAQDRTEILSGQVLLEAKP